MEEILTQQNSLVTDAKVSFVTCDLKANTVTFSVAVIPKTFVEGMTVEFLAENGEISSDVVGRAGEDGTNQRFSATLSIPLTDDIALSALLVLPDGTRQTQPLQTYTGLYSGSLPEVQMLLDADIQGRAAVENGTLTLPEPIEFLLMMNTKLHNVFVPRAEAVSTQVGLFKNKRLIAWAQPSVPTSKQATPATMRLPNITGWSRCPSPLPLGIFWNMPQFLPMNTAGKASVPAIGP